MLAGFVRRNRSKIAIFVLWVSHWVELVRALEETVTAGTAHEGNTLVAQLLKAAR
jgi:hypothetical protein